MKIIVNALVAGILIAIGVASCRPGSIPELGEPGPMEFNTNRPGGDYNNFDLSAADPNICQNSCQADSVCRAWTYVNPGDQGRTRAAG